MLLRISRSEPSLGDISVHHCASFAFISFFSMLIHAFQAFNSTIYIPIFLATCSPLALGILLAMTVYKSVYISWNHNALVNTHWYTYTRMTMSSLLLRDGIFSYLVVLLALLFTAFGVFIPGVRPYCLLCHCSDYFPLRSVNLLRFNQGRLLPLLLCSKP